MRCERGIRPIIVHTLQLESNTQIVVPPSTYLSRVDKGYIASALVGVYYESHLWDSFLYAAADADFAGPAVTLRCPDIL